jgi:hypothetical protein
MRRPASQLERLSQLGLAKLTGCHIPDDVHQFIGIQIQIPIVDQQESDRGVGARPLVAIDERVILAQRGRPQPLPG